MKTILVILLLAATACSYPSYRCEYSSAISQPWLSNAFLSPRARYRGLLEGGVSFKPPLCCWSVYSSTMGVLQEMQVWLYLLWRASLWCGWEASPTQRKLLSIMRETLTFFILQQAIRDIFSRESYVDIIILCKDLRHIYCSRSSIMVENRLLDSKIDGQPCKQE